MMRGVPCLGHEYMRPKGMARHVPWHCARPLRTLVVRKFTSFLSETRESCVFGQMDFGICTQCLSMREKCII